MARRDSNIDPFNAGEPILPWNDPTSFKNDEPEPLSDASYQAPTKRADDYVAPQDDGPDTRRKSSTGGKASSSRSSARPARGTSRRGSSKSGAPSTSPFAGSSASTPARAASPARDAGPTIKAAPSSASQPGPVEHKRSPLFAVIIVIIFLALMSGGVLDGIGGLLASFTGSADISIGDPSSSSDDSSDSGSSEYVAPGYWGVDTDEKKIEEMAQGYVSENVDTEENRAAVATWFDEKSQESIGYSLDGLGVDAKAVSDWALGGLTFTKSSDSKSYIFDGYEDTAPSGSVYFTVRAPNLYGCWSSFRSSVQDYLFSLGIKYYDSAAEKPALTEDQKAHVRELLQQAMDGAQPNEYDRYSVAVIYDGRKGEKGGKWTVDAAQFQKGVTNLLGLY